MKPKSSPKTHFICLPLRSSTFLSKVTSFNALLPSTISPTIIRPTGSLHFTLGVLSLTTPDEINSAVAFLRTCHSDALSIIRGQKLAASLKGIASLQKNLKKASVIYAVREEGDGRLRSLCSIFLPFIYVGFLLLDLIQLRFKEAKFLENDKHSFHELGVFFKK